MRSGSVLSSLLLLLLLLLPVAMIGLPVATGGTTLGLASANPGSFEGADEKAAATSIDATPMAVPIAASSDTDGVFFGNTSNTVQNLVNRSDNDT